MKSTTRFKIGIPALLFSTFLLFGCTDDAKEPAKDNLSTEQKPDIKQIPSSNHSSEDITAEQPADAVKQTTAVLGETYKALEDVAASYEPENEVNADDLAGADVIEKIPTPDPTEVIAVDTELIRSIQQALIERGFNAGSADGISGPKTIAALMAFQKESNLASGKFTRETLEALSIEFD